MEVMIVVLIMGIVTLVGLPLLSNSMNHYILKGAAQEVVNSFHFARSSAMDSGRKTMVEHNVSSNKIRVFQFETQADLVMGGDELVAANVETGSYKLMKHPLKKGKQYQVILHNQYKGTFMTLTDFDETDPVYFDILGIPSHGGSATLAVGDQQMIVTLDALTGKTSVSQ
jgi:hypothetical protein